MTLYLRDWEMPDPSPGIQVSGDLAAGGRKWECWEDTDPATPSTPNRHGPGMPIWRATPSLYPL